MRRAAGLTVLVLAVVALAGCGIGGFGEDEAEDDPAPSGDEAREELGAALATTEAAGGGSFETGDDLVGDVSTASGTFTQDPPAFEVSFGGEGGRPGGSFVLVDGVTYGQDGDGPWEELGPLEADAPLLDVGAVPSQLLQVLLDLDAEPAGIEPIDGAEASYRWQVTAEDVGFPSDYGDAHTVVDVAVDDEGRVVQVQARVDRVDESLPGGAFTIDLTYEETPPVTAPEDVQVPDDVVATDD
jgi:hypothetical protein